MPPIIDPDRLFINKWEMHKVLKQEDSPDFELPDTAILSLESLDGMLKKHSCVYVKPTSSWGGKNISKIDRHPDSLIWRLQGQPPQYFSSVDHLFTNLSVIYNEELCIVQQCAPLLMFDHCPFDIRTHLLNDLVDGWIYAGDLIRIGGKGSVVSNVNISKGTVKPTSEVLSKLIKSEREIVDKLVHVSLSICKVLDKYHSFVEVGIDFGIDKKGTLWLIEVNTDDMLGGPERKLFQMLPDKSTYEEIDKRSDKIYAQRAQLLVAACEKYLKEKSYDE